MHTVEQQVAVTIAGLRVILLSFIAGLVTFGVVALLLVSSGFEVRPDLTSILLPILGGLLLLGLVGSSLFRRLRFSALASSERRRTREERLQVALPVFRQLTIVSAVLAEAPAIFGVVTYLLTGNPIGLLVSALGVIRLVLLLPSAAVLESIADLVGG